MIEPKIDTHRLLSALENRIAYDPAKLKQLAALISYDPDKLRQDIITAGEYVYQLELEQHE